MLLCVLSFFVHFLSIYSFIFITNNIKVKDKTVLMDGKIIINKKIVDKKGRLGANLNVFLFFGRKHFCNSQLFSRIDNGGWKTFLSMNRI